MIVSGKGTTIVILDWGPHALRVHQVVKSIAPDATIEIRPKNATAYVEADMRAELVNIAANPGNIVAIVIPWCVGTWCDEIPPDWTKKPGKGFEPQLQAIDALGICIAASAGDDRERTGDKAGAGYLACSPYSFPVMGSAFICNRTIRGVLCNESASSSLAAPVLAGVVALIRSSGLKGWLAPIMATVDEQPDEILGTVQVLNIDRALSSVGLIRGYPEQPGIPTGAINLPVNVPSAQSGQLVNATDIKLYTWESVFTGKMRVTVEPSTLTLVRYLKTEPPKRQQGFVTLGVKEGKQETIGVTGGVGTYDINFKRVA